MHGVAEKMVTHMMWNGKCRENCPGWRNERVVARGGRRDTVCSTKRKTGARTRWLGRSH